MDWMAYGMPKETESDARILANRLAEWKTGVKVEKYGNKFLVFTYDKPREVKQ